MADDNLKDVEFFNPHAGLTGRDGGPYLDQAERNAAEINRAFKENREPDFKNATFTPGTPATTLRVLAQVPADLSVRSMVARDLDTYPDGPNVYETLPVDTSTEVPVDEDEDEDEPQVTRNIATSDPNATPANVRAAAKADENKADENKSDKK